MNARYLFAGSNFTIVANIPVIKAAWRAPPSCGQNQGQLSQTYLSLIVVYGFTKGIPFESLTLVKLVIIPEAQRTLKLSKAV